MPTLAKIYEDHAKERFRSAARADNASVRRRRARVAGGVDSRFVFSVFVA
jgi:hypothetical protein